MLKCEERAITARPDLVRNSNSRTRAEKGFKDIPKRHLVMADAEVDVNQSKQRARMLLTK